MARFYGLKVLEGSMGAGEVPRLWRAATERWLELQGKAGNNG